MSHLLVIELPSPDDPAILEAAYRLGHTVTFATAGWSYYDASPQRTTQAFSRLLASVETPPHAYEVFEEQILARHRTLPFDAVLCLTDIRLIDAARIAKRLGLPYLAVESAVLLRDKYSVRTCLSERGIPQPDFLLAESNEEILSCMERLGAPVLMKPSDGFGSQHIIVIRDKAELYDLREALSSYLPIGGDYGYGSVANGRQLIERYMVGKIVGCDSFTVNGKHFLLGINEKCSYAPPLLAIRGSVFPSQRFDIQEIQDYLFATLSAVGFNCGAAHTELILTADGWRLIEINGRLVGAGIGDLLSTALDRSVHELLISVHLGEELSFPIKVPYFAATRWVSSPTNGTFVDIEWPTDKTGIKAVTLCHLPGEMVYMPLHNGARLACVISRGSTMEEAEAAAERYVAQTKVSVDRVKMSHA